MNAKEEYLRHTEGADVKCAEIRRWFSGKIKNRAILRVDHTEAEHEQFLKDLDFDYDSLFGLKEVYGTIWYEDGSWSDRHEYYGAERWTYRCAPPITEEVARS